MKCDGKKKAISWKHLLTLALAMSLGACGDGSGPSASGGSGSGSGGGGGKTEKGPTTGKLLDAAVSGVGYAAASGATGTTDENGIFKFNHGDTVEFKLGSLVLGKVPGAAIITPMELAGDNDHRLRNLLVLFQSLDADGNPANGISIPAAAASALSASIKLDSEPAAFVASPELQKAREAAGISGPVKTPVQATGHFLSQGMAMLSNQVWVKQDDGTASIIRIAGTGANGAEYLQGEATPDDSCDTNRVCGGNLVSKAGVEYGTAHLSGVNNRGFKFAAKPVIDTNLQAGLSHPRPNWRVRSDGYNLITSDIFTVQRKREQKSLFGELFHIAGTLEISSSKEPIKTEVKEIHFSPMENDPKGITGAWIADPASMKTPMYLFFSNGKYMMVDPVGDVKTADHESCGDPGVEFASYTYDSGGKVLNIKGFTYDTNGCAGFSTNGPVSFSISADGKTATLNMQDKNTLTLHRVSK
ncbi:adhesin [Nitrosospira sp. Is2]|uniref:adhesin n=1 Tax=Nitrosospira sp. Is2 TaxID=3080532 RepID=UPI002952BAF5|nr:adhesin [Nitrosospira sp. Is2]WON73982.1 adhesin [Nitrosospira sp. Is2]